MNSIRLFVVASLLPSGEAQMTQWSRQSWWDRYCTRYPRYALTEKSKPNRRDDEEWLETQWPEDSMTWSRETWAATWRVFMFLREPKSPLPRSQSVDSSEEAG